MTTATERKPLSKTELFSQIAEETGLTRKEVGSVFESLNGIIAKEVGGRRGPGALTIPSLLKIVKIKKPATKAKKGVPNPFKPGETMDVAAKPARNIVKVRPLKGLKDAV
jgi:nucleoid DNA-binding protein